jgi:hypothetical protein
MLELILIATGFAAGVVYCCWRLRDPETTLGEALRKVLPFGAGGPGPRR